MTKIDDEYRRWLVEQLNRRHKIELLGACIWLKWCEDLHLRLPQIDPPAAWFRVVSFLVGWAEDWHIRFGFFQKRLSGWWMVWSLIWVYRMWRVWP